MIYFLMLLKFLSMYKTSFVKHMMCAAILTGLANELWHKDTGKHEEKGVK